MGSTNNLEGCIALGPWGGSKGKPWTYRPGGFIRNIIVKHGIAVDSITFQTCNSKGETQSSIFVGKSCNKTELINFNYDTEYLMSVSGTISDLEGSDVVTSICFETNEDSYGPYGTKCGSVFSNDCGSGVIVGFHGCEDKYLTAIGVYVMPESLAFVPNSTYQGKIIHELYSSMTRMAMPKHPGPWGAGGGNPWDDGVFTAIKQVHVHLGDPNVIHALQFHYQKKDGTFVMSEIHEETYGTETELVVFNSKDEYLIGVSGFYGAVEGYNGLEAIASISFHTNKAIYGPFGDVTGAGYVYYSSTASPGKVVGFHGRSHDYLSAIGVHMEYF